MAQEVANDPSRRTFLAVAGVGAAGVAAASVVAPRLFSGSGSTAAPSTGEVMGGVTALPSDASGSLVAVVKDVQNGLVSVLVGEHEVIVRDRELVARLATAAKKAGR